MHAASTLSVAGLTPITASPAPSSSPSSVDAATPRGSSVGWFGCRRTERRPGRPIVLRKRVTTRHLAATAIEVLQAHQLADRGRHLGRKAGAQRGQRLRFGGQQELAELAHGERGHRRERRRVVAVDDQPGDFVGFVRNHRLGEDRCERHVGQRHLRRHALGGGCRGDPGERVAGTERRCARQQRAQVVEDVARAGECVRVGHSSLPATPASRPRTRICSRNAKGESDPVRPMSPYAVAYCGCASDEVRFPHAARAHCPCCGWSAPGTLTTPRPLARAQARHS